MKSSNGPLIGTIIIVILLVLAALYVFMEKLAENTSDEVIDNEALTIEAELMAEEKEMGPLETELEAANY